MNYYDEEISIGGPDTKHLGSVKVDRLPSGIGSIDLAGSGAAGGGGIGGASGGRRSTSNRGSRGRQLNAHNSADDDGLLHEIIDHDDDGDHGIDDDDDDDDSDAPKPPTLGKPPSSSLRLQTQPRPGSARHPLGGASKLGGMPKALDDDTDDEDPSETESDDVLGGPRGRSTANASSTATVDLQLSITPEKWESLAVHQDVKDIFPFILKYTPQSIETQYHLQPFIPDYVPAVGDVDAFLKVTVPPLLHPARESEVNEHLGRMGLYFLDEPSGQQSEPSLLNMKLRSVLSGSGGNARSSSAHLVPVAKAAKDIDKWIAEVEQVHMTQSVFDAQPRKDIDALLVDWPRSFAETRGVLIDAYQRQLQEDLSLPDYIRLMCQQFEIEAKSETQTDLILNVQTLFALYLAANQAWE